MDELYPLYLNAYHAYQRSKLHFEKLTGDCTTGAMTSNNASATTTTIARTISGRPELSPAWRFASRWRSRHQSIKSQRIRIATLTLRLRHNLQQRIGPN